jgi:hypothetical protein
VLYPDLPRRDIAVCHAADHESHVYADDDQVLLQALIHGELRVLYPHRLPEHLESYW